MPQTVSYKTLNGEETKTSPWYEHWAFAPSSKLASLVSCALTFCFKENLAAVQASAMLNLLSVVLNHIAEHGTLEKARKELVPINETKHDFRFWHRGYGLKARDATPLTATSLSLTTVGDICAMIYGGEGTMKYVVLLLCSLGIGINWFDEAYKERNIKSAQEDARTPALSHSMP